MRTLDTHLARLARLEYASTIADPMVADPGEPRRLNLDKFAEVNKDLWLILALLAIAAAANHLLAAQRLILGFYTLPTIFAAFYRGRRHATLTAAASALLVGFMSYINPDFWSGQPSGIYNARLYDLATWGLMLMLTAYTMGTLHERFVSRSDELRQTYHGLLMILRQFINQDKDAANHSYRVSVYAVTIAEQMKLDHGRVELVRAAAMLLDLGKLDTSRDVLQRAAELTLSEQHQTPDPMAASMGRVLPIILAHHDHFDGGDYRPVDDEEIPLEARVIAVADVYDALINDRPYRKAVAPFEARETIRCGTGSEFDPVVVKAFLRAYDRGLLEVSEVYV